MKIGLALAPSKLTIVGVAKSPDPVKPDFGPFFPDPVAKNPSGTPLHKSADKLGISTESDLHC